MKKATPQPQLPFISLEKVDGRNEVRKVSILREERLHWISETIIVIRPGKMRPHFNWRIQGEDETEEQYEMRLGIPDLAAGMFKSNGPDDALIGDFKDQLFYLNEGERRIRGIRFLLKSGLTHYPNGRDISVVEVLQNPKDFTDKDRRRRIYTSQAKMKLSPMELAYGYLEMKEEDGLTNQQIAEELGVSRQTIDNYIVATTFDKETQRQVDAGEIPITTAIKFNRQKKAKDKQAEGVTNEIPDPPASWRKDKTDKDLEDEELLPPQDNSVSKAPTRLKEDKGSAAHVYNEPEEEIWKRAIKMMVGLQEQDKSAEYIIAELKVSFAISSREGKKG